MAERKRGGAFEDADSGQEGRKSNDNNADGRKRPRPEGKLSLVGLQGEVEDCAKTGENSLLLKKHRRRESERPKKEVVIQ